MASLLQGRSDFLAKPKSTLSMWKVEEFVSKASPVMTCATHLALPSASEIEVDNPSLFRLLPIPKAPATKYEVYAA